MISPVESAYEYTMWVIEVNLINVRPALIYVFMLRISRDSLLKDMLLKKLDAWALKCLRTTF